ncbi:MAG: recombination mediator RecR [Candidatus Margulisiibacteriota bacterium]
MSQKDPLSSIVFEFSKMPGIGQKTAQRLAFYLLSLRKELISNLIHSIEDLRDHVGYCKRCFHLTYEADECVLCSNPSRDGKILCLVGDSRDVLALEKMGRFKGLYHVLGGVISPLDGLGPEQLRIKELLSRLKTEPVEEIVFALSPSIEGETTTLYLTKLLKGMNIKLTQIAYGIPMGSDLEWADELTLGRAFEGRNRL